MNHRLSICYCVFACVLGIALPSIGQNLPFRNYTALDGLSSSEVYDIAQDNQGYLWFATDRGLTRYDGVTFEQFAISDGLPDNVVFNFFEQSDGTIWCSTSKQQLFYFKNASEGFHEYPFNEIVKKNIGETYLINDIIISTENEIYITNNGLIGYLKIDDSGAYVNTIDKTITLDTTRELSARTVKDLPEAIFLAYSDLPKAPDTELEWNYKEWPYQAFSRMLVFPEHDTRLGFLGNTYLKINKDNSISEQMLPYPKKQEIMVGKYDEHTFWVGYQYGGVAFLDLEGKIKSHLLKENSVTKVFTDHEGGLWISTLDQGVFYCRQPQINHRVFESYPIELTKNNRKELFIGLHNGDVLKKNTIDNKLSEMHISETNYKAHAQYNAIKDTTYFGDIRSTHAFTLGRKNITGISDDEFFPVAYSRGAIYLPDRDTIQIKHMPSNIFDIAKKEDHFLIGTDDGLYQYKDDELKSLFEKSPYFSYRISDIDYRFGKLQMSTMGSGFVIEKRDTLFAIREKDGLLSDICTEVFAEDKYTTWVGTNRGLSRVILYENNTYEIKNISVNEGLPCSEITDIEIIDDILWVAAKEGLFSFSKDLLEVIDEPQEKWLHFNEITVNDTVIDISEQSRFSYKENTMDFSFKSISFSQGDNALYRYKLQKKDSLWQYTGNQSVRLTNMSPGTYDFILQTQLENKTWTPSIQYSYVILNPFWKSWWFIGSIVLSIFLLTYITFKYRVLIFDRRLANHIGQELLDRLKIRNEKPLFVAIKQDGKTIRLSTTEIGYFKSARNYTEIFTVSKKYLIRKKLNDFYEELPDKSEYVRLHRSYYVRIDKVKQKGAREVVVMEETIPVSKTYFENLDKIMSY